jgi:phage tail-like protein
MASKNLLIVQLDGQTVMEHTASGVALTIGRLPDNRLVLPHRQVSRRHAEIRFDAQGPVLTDLGSMSGTFVDGVRLLPQQPRLLAAGASIQIGPYTILYLSREDEGESDIPRDKADAERSVPVTPVPPPTPVRPPRQTWRVVANSEARSAYLQHLPSIFHESDFLARFLMIFETIWEPLEQRQENIAMYFDPRTSPSSLLRWIGSWFGLEVSPHWPEGRTRDLLSSVVELYRWSGTEYGLSRMIEVCTGATPEISEVPDQPFVFRFKIVLPRDGKVDREFVEQLIKNHKPAHVGYVLEVQHG